VLKQAAAVLLYSSFLGALGILPESWGVPIRTSSQNGYVCAPIEYDLTSMLFYFLVFFAAMSGLPITYIAYICFDIWRRSLMPRKGQRKQISIYLLRVSLVMLLSWLPCTLYKYLPSSVVGPWVQLFFSLWIHLQPLLSVVLMLGKSDIRQAVMMLISCRACCGRRLDEDKGNEATSSTDRSYFGFSLRRTSSILRRSIENLARHKRLSTGASTSSPNSYEDSLSDSGPTYATDKRDEQAEEDTGDDAVLESTDNNV